MNEAEAGKALLEAANSQVIMTEVVIYAIISILLILLMDAWVAEPLETKLDEYKVLKIPGTFPPLYHCGVYRGDRPLCMYNNEFSVTRGTLTYFGLPYFIALFYYLIKMLRRVRSVQKRRKL